MPVADVVVVHVLVDILRIRLGGKLRLDFYNEKKKFKKLKISIILELTSYIIIKGRILILIVKPTFSLTFHILIHNELAFPKTIKKNQ